MASLECLNSNCSVKYVLEDQQWKRYQYSIAAPILAVLGVCATLVNIYVLLSAFFLKRSASLNLWFSLSLAAVDTYSAVLIVVNLFLQSYFPFVLQIEPDYCVLIAAEMLRLGGLVTSVFHLFALALTHFLGVAYPLRQHAWIATRNRRVIVLLIFWICPSVALFVCMSSVPDEGFLSPRCANLKFASEWPFRAAICAAVATPMLATFAFYFAILRQLKENDRDPVLKEARPTRQNKKLFFTMMLLMGTFLVGWFPSLVFYVLCCENCLFALREMKLKSITAIAIFVQLLIILKLFSNPLIYALRITELRFALCQLNRKLFGAQLFASETTSQQQTSRPGQRPRQEGKRSKSSNGSAGEQEKFLRFCESKE